MKAIIREDDTHDVEIDIFDLYDLDVTLAKVILPALEKFSEFSESIPMVDDEDVPEYIREYKGEERSGKDYEVFLLTRWKYVLYRMTSSFEELVNKGVVVNPEAIKGIELFGKYYTNLWI